MSDSTARYRDDEAFDAVVQMSAWVTRHLGNGRWYVTAWDPAGHVIVGESEDANLATALCHGRWLLAWRNGGRHDG